MKNDGGLNMKTCYNELLETLRRLDIHTVQIQSNLYRSKPLKECALITAQQNFKDCDGNIQCITITKRSIDDIIACAEYFKNVNGTVTQLEE